MKKQLSMLTAMSISAFIAFGVLFSNGALNRLTNIHAASFSYGVTFNSTKNKFHASTGGSARDGTATIQTNLGNDIAFSYSRLKGANDVWHVLGSGGSFYNVDPIHGIESISLSFKTDGIAFSVYYSGGNLLDKHQSFVSSSAEAIAFDFDGFRPNFIKIVNDGASDLSISAVNIALSCEDNYETLNGAAPMISEDKKTVTYGLYPQAHVGDSSLVAELNKLGASAIGANHWYLYRGSYYAKTVAQPYFYSLTYSDGLPVTEGETVWFKCEPILWRVLSSDEGYLLMSEMTLDRMYYTTHESSYDDEQGKYVSISNYFHSDIRSWLNDDFLNSAFALNNDYVLTTTVDNSFNTCNGENKWNASPDTEDKVFLPSYKDMKAFAYGFPTSESASDLRTSKATDYAMAKYVYAYEGEAYLHNSIYWTRSPDSENRTFVSSVKWNGELTSYRANGYSGVRPCIKLGAALS